MIRCIFLCVVLVPLLATANSKCLKNGLYEHPTDCDKFYSCAPVGPVLMHCPAGLHFNPQYLICDWPQDDGGCRKAQDSGSSLLQSCPIYPDPKDCTKFYLCSSSGTVSRNCPTGLYFNHQLLVCDWPYNVKCTEAMTSTTAYPVTTTRRTTKKPIIPSENNEIYSDGVSTLLPEIPESGKATTKTTTSPWQQLTTSTGMIANTQNKNISGEVINTSTASSPVQSNSTYLCKGSIWPHPSDCTKYFMCGSTGAVEKFCPDNLFFNPILMVCDWWHNVRCEIILNDPIEITTTERQENISLPTLTTTSSSESSTTFMGDLNETTENIIADHEHTETTGIITENLTISTIPLSPETEWYHSTTEYTIENKLCEGSIWPHGEDCTKFYMCGSIGPVEKLCPQQMHFNPLLLVCDWPYKAGCITDNVTEIITIKSNEDTILTTINFSETVSTEHTMDFTNITEYFEIPTSTKDSTLTTEESTTKEPNITTQDPNTCTSSIWPHSSDCTKYFICDATGTVEIICPEELHFNPLLLICDWPLNVQCNKSLGASNDISTTELSTEETATTQTTPAFSEISTIEFISISTLDREHSETTIAESLNKITTENHLSLDEHIETTISTEVNETQAFTATTTENSETTFVSTTESTATFENIASSESCKSSIWSHPSDCTKYYICGSTGAVEMMCPEELYFNPLLLICDWPLNVQCNESFTTTDESTTIQTTTGSNESTFTINTEYLETTINGDLDKTTTENKLSTDKQIEITTDESRTTERSVSELISTTTEPPNNHTKLCESSIWPYPNNCTKFFMCGSTGAVEMHCPDNMHFNRVLLICDTPYNARCNEFLNSHELTTVELTTEKEIYESSPTSSNSPNDLASDVTTNIGNNFPEIVTMNIDSSTFSNIEHLDTTTEEWSANFTTDNPISASYNQTETVDLTTENEPKKPFTSTIQISENPLSIPSDTSHLFLSTTLCQASIWPHPEDCQKFFICGSSGPVEMSCPEKLQFNPAWLTCDWPDNAGCASTSIL